MNVGGPGVNASRDAGGSSVNAGGSGVNAERLVVYVDNQPVALVDLPPVFVPSGRDTEWGGGARGRGGNTGGGSGARRRDGNTEGGLGLGNTGGLSLDTGRGLGLGNIEGIGRDTRGGLALGNTGGEGRATRVAGRDTAGGVGLGLLLTLFYGGKDEEWAAPRDTYVDVGGFQYHG